MDRTCTSAQNPIVGYSQAHLSEESLELITLDDIVHLESRTSYCLLQEFGHFNSDSKEFTLLLRLPVSITQIREATTYSSKVSFKGGGKHVWEELESYGEQELHEWDKDER